MRCYWILALLLFALAPARAGHSPPPLLLRIHVQTSAQGLPETQAVTITIPPYNETIQIRALPEVNEKELIDVQTDPTGAVHLQFNHEGQVSLNAATAQNEGRIMVVLINGVVVYAPVIDQTINNGQLVLPHALQPNVVTLLQEIAKKNLRRDNKT